MSKNSASLSRNAIIVNLLLCLVTGGAWFLPFGIYILMMWSQKRKPSIALTALHTILSLFTASTWLIVVIIYYIVKKR